MPLEASKFNSREFKQRDRYDNPQVGVCTLQPNKWLRSIPETRLSIESQYNLSLRSKPKSYVQLFRLTLRNFVSPFQKYFD